MAGCRGAGGDGGEPIFDSLGYRGAVGSQRHAASDVLVVATAPKAGNEMNLWGAAMTGSEPKALARIRREGRDTQTLFMVAFWLTLASLIGSLVVWPVVRVAKGAQTGEWPGAWAGVVTDIGLRFVEAMPVLILAGGLWSAQRLFGRIADGNVFTAGNAREVSRIGETMVWGGVAAIVIAPTLTGWIKRTTTFDFSFQDWAIVVILLGAAVVLVGRIWGLAAAIKADADQIV
jgi:hypothetical protein